MRAVKAAKEIDTVYSKATRDLAGKLEQYLSMVSICCCCCCMRYYTSTQWQVTGLGLPLSELVACLDSAITCDLQLPQSLPKTMCWACSVLLLLLLLPLLCRRTYTTSSGSR